MRYADGPRGEPRVVPDFLPPPEDLVFREDGVKVTFSLSGRSVEFFKDAARKYKTQYQRMIRRLLDAYAAHHSRPRRSSRPAATRAQSTARRPSAARSDTGSESRR